MGKPGILGVPFDSDHKACGHGVYSGYPLIYFADPDNLTSTVCVKECPDKIPGMP